MNSLIMNNECILNVSRITMCVVSICNPHVPICRNPITSRTASFPTGIFFDFIRMSLSSGKNTNHTVNHHATAKNSSTKATAKPIGISVSPNSTLPVPAHLSHPFPPPITAEISTAISTAMLRQACHSSSKDQSDRG